MFFVMIGYMQLFLYGLIGSVFALVGGLIVIWRSQDVKKIMTSLLAFAAAAFLGVSFLDLLPEAVEALAEPHYAFIAFLIGLTAFFTLERSLMRYLHKHPHEHGHGEEDDHTESLPALIILGDSLHNFLDGIAIAVAYVADPALGLTTALAVAAHEVPQEIGDFAILLDRGWSRLKVFWVNIVSASSALLGVWIGYSTVKSFESWMPYLLAGVAGIFSYIALSDLIPEIHHRARHKYLYRVLIPFLVGLILIWYLISLTHG
jgi:zinc and cadmium transporter